MSQTRSTQAIAAIAAGAIAAWVAPASAVRADATSQGFQYSDFSSTAGLTLVGSAFASAGELSLTTSARANAGGAWRTQSQADVAQGFDTTFTLRVRDRMGLGADGFAFVIQNESPNALGGDGGALGYASNIVFPGRPGIANSLAIEFDMWSNAPSGQWAEGADNHASIQTAGLASNNPTGAFSLATADLPFELDDGQERTYRISYDQGTMQVFIDDFFNPVLEAAIDLGQILSLNQGRAWVGFTAACGGGANAQRHALTSWTFAGKVPTPGTGVLLMIAMCATASRSRPPGSPRFP